MEKKYTLLGFLLLALVFATACKNKKDIQVSENKINEGTWMVEKINGVELADVDFMRGSPSIIFTDSTSFSGSTSCNQYSAKYTRTETGVNIKMGPMTKMACPGKTETQFIKALSATNQVETKGNVMRFYNNKVELLTFKKVQ